MTCFLTQHLRDMLETVRSCSVGAFRSLRYRETDGREKDPHMQLPVRPSILETKKKHDITGIKSSRAQAQLASPTPQHPPRETSGQTRPGAVSRALCGNTPS